jgi:hypothetical protein
MMKHMRRVHSTLTNHAEHKFFKTLTNHAEDLTLTNHAERRSQDQSSIEVPACAGARAQAYARACAHVHAHLAENACAQVQMCHVMHTSHCMHVRGGCVGAPHDGRLLTAKRLLYSKVGDTMQ